MPVFFVVWFLFIYLFMCVCYAHLTASPIKRILTLLLSPKSFIFLAQAEF